MSEERRSPRRMLAEACDRSIRGAPRGGKGVLVGRGLHLHPNVRSSAERPQLGAIPEPDACLILIQVLISCRMPGKNPC